MNHRRSRGDAESLHTGPIELLQREQTKSETREEQEDVKEKFKPELQKSDVNATQKRKSCERQTDEEEQEENVHNQRGRPSPFKEQGGGLDI